MTREEYQQLVKSSVSFQEMATDLQAKILAAIGEEMEGYIKMFQEEKELMQAALQTFQQETDKIVIDYKMGVQNDKKKKLRKVESGIRKKEIGSAEELIKNL